jgi:hypothetical protein
MLTDGVVGNKVRSVADRIERVHHAVFMTA